MKVFRKLTFLFWYFGHPPWDTGVSPPELLAFLEDHRPGRAIDLGCGTGTNVMTLVKRGWQVTGVDFAPTAIRRARQKIEKAGLRADFYISDVTRLHGIDGPFDFALDLGCFHGLNLTEKHCYLSRLHEILAPGAYWMLYGRIKTGPGKGRPGISQDDLNQIESRLHLLSRQDGYNRSRQQPAAYLLFQKPMEMI